MNCIELPVLLGLSGPTHAELSEFQKRQICLNKFWGSLIDLAAARMSSKKLREVLNEHSQYRKKPLAQNLYSLNEES